MGWEVAPIALKCLGEDGQPSDHVVAGWVRHPFGLDFRAYENHDGDVVGGFTLTHLPTGSVVRQLVGIGTAQAKLIADEIMDAADWSFTDSPPDECEAAIIAIREKYPDNVRGGHETIGPGR